MLTQEQILKLANEASGNSWWSPTKVDIKFAELCYAAGEAAGKVIERKRAEAVDRVMEHVARQTRPY